MGKMKVQLYLILVHLPQTILPLRVQLVCEVCCGTWLGLLQLYQFCGSTLYHILSCSCQNKLDISFFFDIIIHWRVFLAIFHWHQHCVHAKRRWLLVVSLGTQRNYLGTLLYKVCVSGEFYDWFCGCSPRITSTFGKFKIKASIFPQYLPHLTSKDFSLLVSSRSPFAKKHLDFQSPRSWHLNHYVSKIWQWFFFRT